MITTEHDQHCVKSFRIRRFSAPYFAAFGLIRTTKTLKTFKVDSPTHLIGRKQVARMRQDP